MSRYSRFTFTALSRHGSIEGSNASTIDVRLGSFTALSRCGSIEGIMAGNQANLSVSFYRPIVGGSIEALKGILSHC